MVVSPYTEGFAWVAAHLAYYYAYTNLWVMDAQDPQFGESDGGGDSFANMVTKGLVAGWTITLYGLTANYVQSGFAVDASEPTDGWWLNVWLFTLFTAAVVAMLMMAFFKVTAVDSGVSHPYGAVGPLSTVVLFYAPLSVVMSFGFFHKFILSGVPEWWEYTSGVFVILWAFGLFVKWGITNRFVTAEKKSPLYGRRATGLDDDAQHNQGQLVTMDISREQVFMFLALESIFAIKVFGDYARFFNFLTIVVVCPLVSTGWAGGWKYFTEFSFLAHMVWYQSWFLMPAVSFAPTEPFSPNLVNDAEKMSNLFWYTNGTLATEQVMAAGHMTALGVVTTSVMLPLATVMMLKVAAMAKDALSAEAKVGDFGSGIRKMKKGEY